MGSKKVPTVKKKPLSPAGRRRKGHQFERDMVNLFKKIFPGAMRQLEYQKEVAAQGIDLINTGRYFIQCKRERLYSRINAIFQVKIDPLVGGCPVLITKGDGLQPMAVLPLKELIKLIRFREKAIRHAEKME